LLLLLLQKNDNVKLMNRIIIPTDFTKAADAAIKQAAAIALKTQADLILLHVLGDILPTAEVSEKLLKEESARLTQEYGLNCEYMLKTGNIFDVIASEPCKTNYDLMVIGTHGVKGVRQKLFGADILKLVSKVPIPVLVVQEDSPLVETFKKIILPVGSHDSFEDLLYAIKLFTGIYQTEVHLYSINKPGFEWPEQMKKNIEKAIDLFKTKGVQVIRVKEDQTVYSLGYAKQTLNYAKSVSADCICMMSIPSNEYYYFAQADKEHMLENETFIPVLCAGGGS
jgi:nucleotide-binding universal stress UspA family protein